MSHTPLKNERAWRGRVLENEFADGTVVEDIH